MPLIKGVNTSKDSIKKTADFINSLEGNRNTINLLPYHKIAENKHKKLGNLDGFIEFDTPDERKIEEIISIFKTYGIKASVGG
jgi:pyruvate formate lyase activating enzyme